MSARRCHRVELVDGALVVELHSRSLRFRVALRPDRALGVEVAAGDGPFREHAGEIGVDLWTRRHLFAPRHDPARLLLEPRLPRPVLVALAAGPVGCKTSALRLACHEAGCDLLLGAPAIFWLCAERLARGDVRPDLGELLARRRREVLAFALDVEPETISESRVTLLARRVRVERAIRREHPLASLVALARDEDLCATTLRHLPTIPLIIVDLAARHPEHVGAAWMMLALARAAQELARASTRAARAEIERATTEQVATLVRAAEHAAQALAQLGLPDDPARTARDADQLRRRLRRERRRRRHEARDPNVALPPPPLRGRRDILPLRTPADLVEEGEAQHNCVGDLVDDVACGRIYLYAIWGPTGERATASISIRSGFTLDDDFQLVERTSYSLGQVLTAGNGPAAAETIRHVEAWVEEETGSRSG